MNAFRSASWFERSDELGLQNRAVLRQSGFDPGQCAGKPVIALLNNWSELNPCNLGLRHLVADVRRGVEQAGGVAMELNTLTLGEELMKPTAMLYRNLLAMEVEEALRAYPIDGCVLLGGCDKTLPGMLMGAASAGLPTIVFCAGPKSTGHFRGEAIGSGTALWKYGDLRRAGMMDEASWAELEAAYAGSHGTCNVMGTASSVSLVIEALGLMLPGTAALAATDPRRREAAAETGRQIVRMTHAADTIDRYLTPESFSNAAYALLAAGGSTNVILHLLALARRRRVPLDLADFDLWARAVPTLLDLQPAGAHLMEAFAAAGGVPTLLRALGGLIDGTRPTVAGISWSEALTTATAASDVVRSLDAPLQPAPGLAVLRGTLCPRGAVLRLATASPHLQQHTGPALVFRDYEDLRARIDDPELPVSADSVLVLQQAGAVGVPGMPEWGNIPIPAKLLRAGVADMVRISDARMSGTAHGTVILHGAPEAARGGPLALVRDGDAIRLDVAGRRLDLLVDPAELARRQAAWKPSPPKHLRGYPALYAQHVLGPEDGCDFDFLQPTQAAALDFVPPIIGRS